MGHAPKAADALALIVKLVLHVGEQLPGLNDPVTPAGRPDALNVALCVSPDTKVAVTKFVTAED